MENKYIALKDLKPLLPILKNNLLVMSFDSFKIFEDKQEKIEIEINEKIKELTFLILLCSVKDNNLFYQIEEKKFTKTDIVEFNKWYSSEEGDRVFPNNEYIGDAVDYWEINVKNQGTYAIIVQ